ncbi:30S ribosomal protein S30e [Candidatus Bathyarchaeota archaeon]|nr:30S ribosomal protein S30e [Candidatus Bathyarchaeota archaeon]
MPSHGALSKAGKVRSITPTVESKENRSPCPRVNNRRFYNRRIILGRNKSRYRSRRRRR